MTSPMDELEDRPPVRVTQWFDRHTRSWVTEWLAADGGQTGPATYDGTREDAAVSLRTYEDRVHPQYCHARDSEGTGCSRTAQHTGDHNFPAWMRCAS
jgi:hypothetical protein